MGLIERGVELGLLVVAAWPVMRLCTSQTFRHSFTRLWVGLTVVLTAYLVGIMALAWVYPLGLRVLAVVVGVALVYAHWHARPNAGRERGLPPGAMAFCPVDTIID